MLVSDTIFLPNRQARRQHGLRKQQQVVRCNVPRDQADKRGVKQGDRFVIPGKKLVDGQLVACETGKETVFLANIVEVQPPEGDPMNNRDGAAPADEQAVEKQLQAKDLNAPRLRPEDIDALIVNEQYHVFPETTMTVCLLTLANDFHVTGESAAVSPENFDFEIGRQIARRNARDKIWSLEGYALRNKLVAEEQRPEQIARLAHEVNRAYCQALGDNSQPAWEDAPEWRRVSARMGVDLHMMGDFGPEASHLSWMKQKVDDGWVFGATKDPAAKTHPCLVPFDQLPKEQQAKDYLFRGVVHALRRKV